jgi:hypothetical protein
MWSGGDKFDDESEGTRQNAEASQNVQIGDPKDRRQLHLHQRGARGEFKPVHRQQNGYP